MDIAALSVAMKGSALSQQVGISIAKKAMDTAQEDSQALLQMMERSVSPNLGATIDIKV